MQTHRDLAVWQRGLDFVERIYEVSRFFPGEERYGLTSQIRRAAVSIPSNIAEGAARRNTKEFIQFLYVALGSLAEVETQVMIAIRLNYAENGKIPLEELETIRKMLLSLIKSLKEKQ